MKERRTFGELVTQIKRSVSDLCEDLMIPGAGHPLGPAHAYGKSFLISKSITALKDANKDQESHLSRSLKKEAPSSIQNNDTKTQWRVVDSLNQALSLIGRYSKDPSRYTHQEIIEGIKQEATNCGLEARFLSVMDEMGETGQDLCISRRDFMLELKLSDQDAVESATLTLADGSSYLLPELVEMLGEQAMRSHISHLLSMAARLDIIEASGISLMQKLAGCDIPGKLSLGGFALRDPVDHHNTFANGYEAVITLDSYENQDRLMIVVDPPLVFPCKQLQQLSKDCGLRLNVEGVGSYISQMRKLSVDVIRTVNDGAVRLFLTDNVQAIMLARIPLRDECLGNLPAIISTLRKAAIWSDTIADAFSTTETAKSTISIDVAPMDDLSLVVTYWIGEYPARLNVAVQEDGTMITNNDELNESFGGSIGSFPDIIAKLIQ